MRVFLLSPAHCGGRRAELLLSQRGHFPLADRFRVGDPVTLGETFAFLSGLYFRGKLAYAARYSRVPPGQPGVMVITANRGLIPADTPVTLDDIRAFGTVDIDCENPRYRYPLEQSATRLGRLGEAEYVLLGSIATDKYAEILVAALGGRLLFPVDFVGRGDMSRGALLLRAVESDRELQYQPVQGALRRGSRPAARASRTPSGS